ARFQQAAQLPSAQPLRAGGLGGADSAAPIGGVVTGRGGGTAAGAARPSISLGAPVQVIRDPATDRQVALQGVQQIGNKAFYQRAADNTWVDSTVTEEMESQARRVEQFSEEYFDLAEKH